VSRSRMKPFACAHVPQANLECPRTGQCFAVGREQQFFRFSVVQPQTFLARRHVPDNKGFQAAHDEELTVRGKGQTGSLDNSLRDARRPKRRPLFQPVRLPQGHGRLIVVVHRCGQHFAVRRKREAPSLHGAFPHLPARGCVAHVQHSLGLIGQPAAIRRHDEGVAGLSQFIQMETFLARGHIPQADGKVVVGNADQRGQQLAVGGEGMPNVPGLPGGKSL
jgi:hypothetical protein